MIQNNSIYRRQIRELDASISHITKRKQKLENAKNENSKSKPRNNLHLEPQ
jgi:prefoldin subunit 5